jgi:magnesium chelatase family protein
MLAARLPGILPPMSETEALEAATVQSAGSAGFDATHWGVRPFRAPHHNASAAALVGGGLPPRPGEVSLAHHGVLFLDELPEFPRNALEALREPLEGGSIAIARAARQARFPARFQLVAAMNPCPCGYLGDCSGRCRCPPQSVARYRARISGPLADRIDLKVEMPSPREVELAAPPGERSEEVRARVCAARERQMARQGKPNAWLGPRETGLHCACDESAAALLRQAMARLALSARAYHRTLRVARTIADLTQSQAIQTAHVAEAIQYRRVDAGL